jgi:hypothetical protein
MGNFYTDVIQKDKRFNTTAVVNDTALLEPSFRLKAQTVVDAAASAGITLVSTETFRSSQRQQSLFVAGKTQLKTVGVHHYGLAIDFAKKLTNGKLSWDGDWTFMAKLAADAGIISGVDWGTPGQTHSFVDSDHLQGCTVAEQVKLFAGTWYPGASTIVGPVAPVPAVLTPPVSLPPIPSGLSQAQAQILAIADQVNKESFNNWFLRSSIMAFCEVESGFDANAIRHEPSGVTSYGLMQVLDTTAGDLGLEGDPTQMYMPAIGLFYGMKYATTGWNYLHAHLGRWPTLDEWFAGYNEGYGAAAQGRPDPDYVQRCNTARAKWAAIVDPKA